MSEYQGQRKDEALIDGETNRIKHKISNQDGDLSKTTLGSSKQWSNVFNSLRENDFSQFLHLATLPIKNEGRKKTCTNIQDFKNFTSHETFLRTLLEDVLTKMKGRKREKSTKIQKIRKKQMEPLGWCTRKGYQFRLEQIRRLQRDYSNR